MRYHPHEHLPWQEETELQQLLSLYRRLQPARVLEIGTARGGTLRAWLDHAPRRAVVAAVDLPCEDTDYRPLFRRWASPGLTLHCLSGDSHAETTREQVQRVLSWVDFLFIDGDHSYEGVRRDYIWYSDLVRPGGLVAFHDIVPTEPDSPIQVWRLWREIRQSGAWVDEFVARNVRGSHGIGVVYC